MGITIIRACIRVLSIYLSTGFGDVVHSRVAADLYYKIYEGGTLALLAVLLEQGIWLKLFGIVTDGW